MNSTESNSKPARILINSLPKSGTHLLAKAIEILGYQEHFKDEFPKNRPAFFNYREVRQCLENTPKNNPEETGQDQMSIGALTPTYVEASIMRKWLDFIPDKCYIVGHIPWNSLLTPILRDLNYYHVCIIRDPRAVIASSIPFVLDTGKWPTKHFLEDDLKFMSASQRLNFVLEGGYAPKAGAYINSFPEVYRSMLAWSQDPGCLFVRFEDLVGEEGGGSLEKQTQVMKQIVSYLGQLWTEEIEEQLTQIYNPSSRTFRTGKIEGWKDSMDAENLEQLNQYCQPLCQEAGYI